MGAYTYQAPQYYLYVVRRNCWHCDAFMTKSVTRYEVTDLAELVKMIGNPLTWSCQICEVEEVGNPTSYYRVCRVDEPDYECDD